MKQLKIEHITKTYGEKTLFQDISLTITEGERIGFIGVNGTGKSSLLQIISGKDAPDKGEVTKPKDYRIGYLSQDPALPEEATILDAIFQGETESLKAVRMYEKALLLMEKNPEDSAALVAYEQASRKMEASSAWDVETEAKMIVEKLGINHLGMQIKSLSGGQRKRVGLSQVLIETPDLLILDEPTNHLDYASIKWLTDYLKRFKGAVLLVTHDRYFLDQVTNHIVELDQGKLYRYIGNYEKFIEAKAVRVENEMKEVDKNKNLYRRELAWMRRGPQGRGTKQEARKSRFQDLETKVKTKTDSSELELDFQTTRLGKDVFEIKHLSKAFREQPILTDVNLIIQPGERIGITGSNGTGKTTLLHLLAGRLTPDSGELITGQTVNIGYYTQQNEDLDPDKRVITYLQEIGNQVETAGGEVLSVSAMLEKFLFPPQMHGNKISSLSGGEKRRLFLLKILMERPNVLLLDEPTNDLDTQTLTVLEDYLESYAGTVITVSHDRYFLDKVATRLLIFKGQGEITTFYGAYTDYLDAEEATEKKAVKPKKTIVEEAKPEPKQKTRLSYQERREWETIEADIEQLEQAINKANRELEATGANYTKASEISAEIEAMENELEAKMERWEYLSMYVNEGGRQ